MNEITWLKSSQCANGASCVEVAHDREWVLIRDSKFPSGLVLRFTTAEWEAFKAGVRGGDFDQLLTTDPGDDR